jgi:glycosyltransferase involved in cell wall biosynthesis
MRIAMFLDTDFPPDSRVENEAVSLINKGHEVFLFSLSYKPFVLAEENVNGITVCRYKSSNLIYKLSALVYTIPLFSILIKNKIRQFIERVKPDALHIHDMPLAETVFKANRKYKLPVTLDLHEDRPEIMKLYPHLQKFPGNILISPKEWARKQIDFMKMANSVILVTEEANEKYSNLHAELSDKIIVVPNTINPEIFYKYSISKDLINRFSKDMIILYVGDTGLRRGTDTAIKAMPSVIEKFPTAKLVLVGKNSEDDSLRKLVDQLQIGENVIFEGWQNVTLFPSYIKASNVCISPLKRNPHHDTTYANKIFQYMAMGKALVVSDCPAQQNVIENENCGLVHQAENETDLAKKLIQVLSNTETANQMGLNGKKAVDEKWNWHKTSLALITLYNQ